MYLFLEKKGYFTFREIMQFLFLCNVSISVQWNMEVLKRTHYETVNMMKYENEYHEITRWVSKVNSGKLKYLFSSIKIW